MSYKKDIKYILKKYKESQTSEIFEDIDKTGSEEIKRLKTIIDDMMLEKNILENHNSLLKHKKIKIAKKNKKKIKIIKENKKIQNKIEDKINCMMYWEILEEKLEEKINYNMMHWEQLEEIQFEEWLYNKINNTSKKLSFTKT